MKSILALFLFTFPIVANASSILKYKPNSAYCTGNFTGLNLIKYECSDEESGCTFGSYLSLYAQCKSILSCTIFDATKHSDSTFLSQYLLSSPILKKYFSQCDYRLSNTSQIDSESESSPCPWQRVVFFL